MDKMNTEEVVDKQESGGGGFAEFMDNMKSKFSVTNVEEKEVRNSGNGRINFADYMDNMNSKYDNTAANNVQISNKVREIEITDLENSKRIAGEGETIHKTIIEEEIVKEIGDSKGPKYNFGAFMDNMDSEEPPEIIFSKEEGSNAKFSGKISVVDNRSSY